MYKSLETHKEELLVALSSGSDAMLDEDKAEEFLWIRYSYTLDAKSLPSRSLRYKPRLRG